MSIWNVNGGEEVNPEAELRWDLGEGGYFIYVYKGNALHWRERNNFNVCVSNNNYEIRKTLNLTKLQLHKNYWAKQLQIYYWLYSCLNS